MPIVNSDSGEFAGMVTIEDLLEEIVGEIRDENDDELPPIHRRGEGVVEVDVHDLGHVIKIGIVGEQAT